MTDPWDILKLLSDPTRLRILNLLRKEELSVAELQDVLSMGQSRISSHLSILRQNHLVVDRKDGKRTYYTIPFGIEKPVQAVIDASCSHFASHRLGDEDRTNLDRIIERRRQKTEQYFTSIAGKMDKNYCPGRSWEAIGHMLLHFTAPLDIADLGAGEGTVSHLLARQANSIYCIDNSEKMVEVGMANVRNNQLENVHYILGDLEEIPLEDESVDLALMSQSLHHANKPLVAVAEAYRILRPGGKVVILDLLEHTFEEAYRLYADRWLGFKENTLYTFLRKAGFGSIEVNVVSKEEKEPFFSTLLASGLK